MRRNWTNLQMGLYARGFVLDWFRSRSIKPMSDETQSVLGKIDNAIVGVTHFEGCENSHLLCACNAAITRLTQEVTSRGERLDHQSEVLAKQSSELVEKGERIGELEAKVRKSENDAIRDERSFADIRRDRDVFKRLAEEFEQERSDYGDKLTTQSAELTRLREMEEKVKRYKNSWKVDSFERVRSRVALFATLEAE